MTKDKRQMMMVRSVPFWSLMTMKECVILSVTTWKMPVIRWSQPEGSNVILIAEDNPDNLFTITSILDGFGYAYITAKDGEDAVRTAKESRPGLILMDIQLPVLSGMDAARQIKSDPSLTGIPIVAVTAKAMRGDREKILAAGCDDYLSKPIDPAALIEMIRKKLDV